jgi:hypothetical protein
VIGASDRKASFHEIVAVRLQAGSPRPARNPNRQMALAYTAFGYFGLMIVLALLLPGH